jgi:hypothetical protein
MTSKQRIADIILDYAAQGDSYAQEIVRMSDKPREIYCWDVDRKEIEPYLLPFLNQEKNRYFTATALNLFIFNSKWPDHRKKTVIGEPPNLTINHEYTKTDEYWEANRFKENLYWIRGCVKVLTSIFGQPVSRNRWNTRQCRIMWRRAINAPFHIVA